MLALVVLSILSTWLLCAAVCIGIGALLLGSLQLPFGLLEALWTGISLIDAILLLYHFFRPVDLFALFLLAGLGLVGWVRNRLFLFDHLHWLKQTHWMALLLYLPAAALVALRSAGPCEHYDTGLYGATAIHWITTYPAVPGLANLLRQLGFNSSVHTWMAALDQGPWRHLSHHLFVGFLLAVFFASIVRAALRVLRGANVAPVDWFFTLLFVPAAIWAARGRLASAQTDLPTTIVCLVAVAMTFRGLAQRNLVLGQGEDTRRRDLVIGMMLFALAATFKLSSLVFAFCGWVLAALALWALAKHVPGTKRLLASAVILSAAILLPWVGQGLFLSGYPLFPSTVLSIPVDWRVDPSMARFEADFARSFARIAEVSLDAAEGTAWVKPWFSELIREREAFLIPIFFAMVGVLAWILSRAREKQKALPRWLWLLAPATAGLLFWLIEAPAIRFGEPLLWTLGAALGTLAAEELLKRNLQRRLALAGLLLMTGWAAHPRLLWDSYYRPCFAVRTFLRLPEAHVVPRQTASGLTIYVPEGTNQCWDAPLPCTPFFDPRLRLRQAGNLNRGFSVGKSSQPEPSPTK